MEKECVIETVLLSNRNICLVEKEEKEYAITHFYLDAVMVRTLKLGTFLSCSSHLKCWLSDLQHAN